MHTAGTIIDNRYKLLRLLGAGGMGEVWVAHQASLDREVAIKLMKGEDPTLVARFQREARAVSKVHHDNVVVVHDTGVCAATGASFIAMELIEGESLRALVKRGALPLERGLEILRQILAGLAAAHSVGIVHRDIKPENVMLQTTAHGQRAKLVDFGIARTVESGETMTGTGSFVGTPGYTPPEVALGAPNNNPKGDLYAVGCIAFELLAGRPVFTAPNALAIAMKHATDVAPSLAAVRSDVPAGVVALVARLLEKIPALRPTAAEATIALAGARARATTLPKGFAMPPTTDPSSPSGTSASSPVLSDVPTETATVVPPPGANDWVVVTSTPLAVVDVNHKLNVIRITRTNKRMAGDELDPVWKSLLETPGGLDPTKCGLLIDFRLAPPRNDPEFEEKVDRWMQPLGARYRRQAVLVKTATGRLQAARNLRERNQVVAVFSDYDEALRHLTT